MNPLLIVANLIVALMGVALMALAQRVHGRIPKFVTGLAGLALLVLAVMDLPGKTLSQAKPTEVSTQAPAPVVPQELPSVDSQEKVIYIGDLDALAEAISDRLGLADPPQEEEEPQMEPEEDSRPGRDPFQPIDTTKLQPEPERTIPQESDTPPCTGFELLHGKSGGPEPDGCYAVGCAEGYALPMQLQVGAWGACEKYRRLPRLKDCYIITDHDGTQRSMRFNKGSWNPGTCSQ